MAAEVCYLRMMASPQLLAANWPAPANVRALVTTRAGGASRGPYASFNLATHVGDDAASVEANRRALATACRLPAEPVWLTQVHSATVVDVATAAPGTRADGAYSDRAGAVCAVLTADCLPIFICNRAGSEVALLHAGWRGLVAGIVEAGLQRLRSPPSELLVWLGPAIGPRVYEVGEEVRAAFLARDPRTASGFTPARPGKWYMDLYALARQRLSEHAVRSIGGGEYCTATQADLFFSHRRDGATGRMASLLWYE